MKIWVTNGRINIFKTVFNNYLSCYQLERTNAYSIDLQLVTQPAIEEIRLAHKTNYYTCISIIIITYIHTRPYFLSVQVHTSWLQSINSALKFAQVFVTSLRSTSWRFPSSAFNRAAVNQRRQTAGRVPTAAPRKLLHYYIYRSARKLRIDFFLAHRENRKFCATWKDLLNQAKT